MPARWRRRWRRPPKPRVSSRALARSRCARRRISRRSLEGARGRRPRARAAAPARARRRSSPRSTRRSPASGAVARRFPRLGAIVEPAASFEREIADVRRKIDPSGEVVDDASPELRSLRDRLRKQRARLRGTLESYLRGKDTAKYLQQQIVTDRNGRYVLVVRAEHRTAIPGIVHGSSASGASLFLEPLSTVEINNDIVALEQQEQEEVRRILLALADALPRPRRRSCTARWTPRRRSTSLQAKARYSLRRRRRRCRACRATGGSSCAARAIRCSIAPRASSVDRRSTSLLIPPVRALVITGPNTGGKTVALKTAGLLPMMAQAGLLIPAAEGTQVPIFHGVFADIGDEQSIADNLSTFSAHIANVVAMDKALALPALVLLDEAGGGTDPNEGGALATAIIDHFRRRGAMVVATTHFDALKTYASTTEGVASAGFGFNPETFAPTYRLHYGSPGSSLALEIATRLGLPGDIIEQARAQRTRARGAAGRAPGAGRARACRRSSTSTGWSRASAQMVEETQTKLQAASRSCATARRRSASGSTRRSRSGCATRGGRSTRWWTR